MNAETVSPAASDRAVHGSPGGAIRAARTRAGLSLEELASRTRLARHTLEALENDAFDQLLEPVYVRGYYRKCASTLGIPEQPLIAAYDALYAPPPKAPPTRVRLASGDDLGSSPRFATKFALFAPIAAVALIAVLWLARQASTPQVPPPAVTLSDPTLSESAEPSAPAVSEFAPPIDAPVPVGEPAAGGAPSADAAPIPADPAAVAATAPGEVSTPATTPAAAPVPTGSELVLEFQSISWARVEDANGKSLLSGVISAGEMQTLNGKPPYAVFLGNAPGVKVRYGGVDVDVKPFLKSNSTARFSVPAAGN